MNQVPSRTFAWIFMSISFGMAMENLWWGVFLFFSMFLVASVLEEIL